MKTYFLDIGVLDYIVALGYNGILTLCLVVILTWFRIRDFHTYFMFLLFFQFYIVLILLDSHFCFLPFSPDTIAYSWLIESGEYPGYEHGWGIEKFYYFNKYFGWFYGYNAFLYTIFHAFVYVVSVLIFLKAWHIYAHTHNKYLHTQLFLTLVLILPSAALYMTAPLREAWIMIGFSLFILGLTRFYKSILSKHLILGNILLYLFRPQLLFYSIISIGVFNTLKMKRLFFIRLSLLFISVGILVYVFQVLGYKISPEWLEYLRNNHISTYENSTDAYGLVEWSTYWDIMMDIPLLTLQFILSPLPIIVNINPLDKLFGFFDSLFILFLIIVLLINIRSLLKEYLFWVLLIIIFSVLLGIYEYTLTGAIRHRLPIVLVMLLPASEYIRRVLVKLTL